MRAAAAERERAAARAEQTARAREVPSEVRIVSKRAVKEAPNDFDWRKQLG